MRGDKIKCPVCNDWFYPLGYSRHRAMHYEQKIKRERIKQRAAQESGLLQANKAINLDCGAFAKW